MTRGQGHGDPSLLGSMWGAPLSIGYSLSFESSIFTGVRDLAAGLPGRQTQKQLAFCWCGARGVLVPVLCKGPCEAQGGLGHPGPKAVLPFLWAYGTASQVIEAKTEHISEDACVLGA